MAAWPIKPDQPAGSFRRRATLEVKSLIDALQTLSFAIEESEVFWEWPEWLTGEVLDELRDPVRLVQGVSAITHVNLYGLGLVEVHVSRLGPSPALAAMVDWVKARAIDRDRSVADSRLCSLRSIGSEQQDPAFPMVEGANPPEGRTK